MKMRKILKIIIFGLILVSSVIFCRQALAAFGLSYVFDEGGSRLEFDRVNFSRAVTFSASNDTSNRYEIRQRIESPLRSRDNPSVTIGNNFVVRGFRGSNHYGDLRIPASDIVVRNDELIYVSDTAGSADSFTLVYGITNSQELAPGYYTGRVSIILSPVSSSAMPVTEVLEVYVNIPNDGGSLSVSVAPAEGASSIILNLLDTDDLRGTANAVVTINSSFNGPFRIMQMLPGPIQSQEGKFIDNRNLLFSIPDAQQGVAVNQPTPISSNIQTIYSSRPNGSADKAFTIAYSLADPLSLVAGSYRSRIQYLLESAGKQINLGALDLEIRQERIFEISISPQDQRYSIDFVDLKPSAGPRLNEVLIEVKSNLGRPYQVTQNVLSELVNSKGDKIPAKYFSLQTFAVDNTKGNLKIASKIPVEKGNALLFISDINGSADRFKVIYELICPVDLMAGNYSSRITYTLTEI
ncbi:MAG: hypothetical protein ABIH91_02955 [Candidatus Omnitrophota bacterium]